MSVIDDILKRVNLKYEDLTVAERDTLSRWVQVLDSNQLTVDTVIDYVRKMRSDVEDELNKINETPNTWIGIFSLFVPFYGLIKKWYQDQYRVQLQARIRNLVMLESFLISPRKAREALNAAIAGMVSSHQ